MAATYNSGWNVQSFLDALNPARAYTNEQLLAQQNPLNPDITNQQWIQQMFGYDNPLQQLGSPIPDVRDSSGDAGEMFDKYVMAATGGALGAGIASWAAGGLGAGAGGVGDAAWGVNAATEAGTGAGTMSGALDPSLWYSGLDLGGYIQPADYAGAFDTFGSLGTPAVQGVGGLGYLPADLGAYMGQTGSGLWSALTGTPGFGNIPTSLLNQLAQTGGTGSADALKRLLGGGIGGLGDLASLAGRTAPGLAALAYASQQKPVDTSGLAGVASAAGQPLRGIDTSALQQLIQKSNAPLPQVDTGGLESVLRQAQANAPLYVQSMLTPAQQAFSLGYGDLLQSQAARGVRGSSFGDQDISNYITDQARTMGNIGAQATQSALGLQGELAGNIANVGLQQNQQLLSQLGLQGNLANNQANIGLAQNQQDISRMGLQGNLAAQLAGLNLQQQQVQNQMYGRAFDVLGRGLSPSGYSTFGSGGIMGLGSSIFGP